MTRYRAIPNSRHMHRLAAVIAVLVAAASSAAFLSAQPSRASSPAAATAAASTLEPVPTPTLAPCLTPSPAVSPSVAPTASPASSTTATPVDGIWEVTTTRDELLAAGAGPDEDDPANYGHGVMDLRNGIWSGYESDGVYKLVGTYQVDCSKILFTLTTTADAGTVFDGTWEMVGDKLKFGGDIPTPLRVKPYTRIDATGVSVLDGHWSVDTTHEELLAVPGLLPGEDGPNNYGHFELDLHNGIYQLSSPDGSAASGTFFVDGNMLYETVTAGADTGARWSYTWQLQGNLLTLGGDVPASMRVKPWTMVGS